jgi:hypothetical protein
MQVSKQRLLNEIREAMRTLASPGSPSLTLASAADDMFEVFIFYIVLAEAINAGARVWLRLSSVGHPPTVTFRTSPGCITANDTFTYALLDFTGLGGRPPYKIPLEVHVGVFVAARSKHYEAEYDVCALLASEVDKCRRNVGGGQTRFRNRLPESSKAKFAIECKYRRRDLGTMATRALIGLKRETQAEQIYYVINTPAESVGRRVMSCAESGARWEPNIYPGSLALRRLRGVLYQTFTDYIFATKDRQTSRRGNLQTSRRGNQRNNRPPQTSGGMTQLWRVQ